MKGKIWKRILLGLGVLSLCCLFPIGPGLAQNSHHRLHAGNHREAGAFGGSQGLTLCALSPWEDGEPAGSPPGAGQNLDALALVYYPEIVYVPRMAPLRYFNQKINKH